jgi:transposase
VRVVPITRFEPQDLQALHRVWEQLMKARTLLVNELRGRLNEYGIILSQGVTKFRASVVNMLEDEQAVVNPCCEAGS